MLRIRLRTPLWLLLASALLLPSTAWGAYNYYLRADLADRIAADPYGVVGEHVVFTDELVAMWGESPDRPNRLQGRRFVLFDTVHFRCAIPADRLETHLQSISEDARRGFADALRRLDQVNNQEHERTQGGEGLTRDQAEEARREIHWEIYRIWRNQPILTVYGTVSRVDFWGGVDARARQQGAVQPETVTIVVDRIERPRERWYEEGLDAD